MVEAVVSVTAGEIRSWEDILGQRPALLFVEAMNAIFTTKEHPEYVAALERRGITDVDNVQIDPWPAGSFGYDAETDRRIARCISFVRETPEDNGYARPIEGLIVHFDLGRNEVIEVIDHGITALPTEPRALLRRRPPATARRPEAARDHTTRRTELHRRREPGHLVTLVVPHRLRPVRGNDTAPDHLRRPRARARTVVHRASVSEMVVPYGDPGPLHGWKNAFDAGEWGLGRMTQGLTLGCDCLGEIHYFDATLASENGDPYTVENAICLHEEDYGILWKHVDLFSGTSEVRRSRRLVVNTIATVGNYEYAFCWYLYLDGNIQLEVKLTGIVSPMAIEPGTTPEFANVVAPGVAAPHHQHLFNVRLDMDVDGPENEIYEVEAESLPFGDDNPWGNAFRPRSTLLASESAAQRRVDPATSRCWKVVNPHVLNGLGQPVAYKLVPTMSTPTMLAQPESSVGRRAGFAQPEPLGDAVLPRRAARGRRAPEPARGRRRAAPVDRSRPQRSSIPTSSSGTRSASPTSSGPRTGRSCPSSTPASCSARSASSTATPPWTSPPARATATTTDPTPRFGVAYPE